MQALLSVFRTFLSPDGACLKPGHLLLLKSHRSGSRPSWRPEARRGSVLVGFARVQGPARLPGGQARASRGWRGHLDGGTSWSEHGRRAGPGDVQHMFALSQIASLSSFFPCPTSVLFLILGLGILFCNRSFLSCWACLPGCKFPERGALSPLFPQSVPSGEDSVWYLEGAN